MTLLRLVNAGKPSTGAIAGALGLAIACILQDSNTPGALYWILYSFWALLTLAFVVFSYFGITPARRPEYLCLALVIETICILFLVTALSISTALYRLQAWGPIITVVSTIARTFAFEPLVEEPDIPVDVELSNSQR